MLWDKAGLQEKLRAALSGREALAVGKFQFIALERIREHFGDDWERVRPRVLEIAAGTIDGFLEPKDLSIHCYDLGFIVLFHELSLNEAAIKALMIATRMVERIMGEDVASVEDVVSTIVAEVNGDLVLQAVDYESALSDLLDEGLRQREAAEAAESQDAPWSDAMIGAPDGFRPIHAPIPLPELARQFSFVYRPIWDVSRNALATYLCVVARWDAETPLRIGYDALLAGMNSPLLPDLDVFMLRRVAGDLKRLHQEGRRILIMCSLHFATFANMQSRERMRMLFRELPKDLMRDVVIELVGFSDEIPHSRLVQAVSYVRTGVRSVVLRVDLDFTRFLIVRNSGVSNIAVDLCDYAKRESEALAKMEDFVAEARKLGMTTLAHGIGRRSLAVGALGAGFTYVEGEAISPPVTSPEHVFRYDLNTLFGDCDE